MFNTLGNEKSQNHKQMMFQFEEEEDLNEDHSNNNPGIKSQRFS